MLQILFLIGVKDKKDHKIHLLCISKNKKIILFLTTSKNKILIIINLDNKF